MSVWKNLLNGAKVKVIKMSGGSYNYIYSEVDMYCVGKMYDSQMNELIKDLVPVLHALEWWRSSDIDEEDYREEVTKFKKKWFGMTDSDIQKYVSDQMEKKKNELLKELEYLKEN